MMWGWDPWGMLWMLLFWVGIVLVGIWAVARLTASGGSRREPEGRDRALEILEERFARGEIDREEFEERRRTLRGE